MTASRSKGFARVAGWNLLLLLAGLAAIFAAGEAFLRFGEKPPPETRAKWVVHPRAGLTLRPNSEYWIATPDWRAHARVNSFGFLAPEPIDRRRAAESCHVAVIGDSFVQGSRVSGAEKLHMQLEELAAVAAPELDVTASGWGIARTGQVAQLGYYDEFARHMRPKLVVLVFNDNDWLDNVPILLALVTGEDPDRMSSVTAERGEDGAMTLRPPEREPWLHRLPRPSLPPARFSTRAAARLLSASFAARWLDVAFAEFLRGWKGAPYRPAWLGSWRKRRAAGRDWVELLAKRPLYASVLAASPSPPSNSFDLMSEASPALREYALEFTAFGLDQFKSRADRDEAALVVLATHRVRMRDNEGAPVFATLGAMAEERGVPVIDQHEYVLRQGVDIRDVYWDRDLHWNADGHRLAAEAVLEWLGENRWVCDGVPAPEATRP